MRNCDAVEALMTRYVDGEALDVDRRAVEVHLSSCMPCRTRVAAQAAVRRLVRTRAARARALGVSPPWRPRAIAGDPAQSARRLSFFPAWALMAAAVLLAVGGVWLVRPSTVSATGIIVDSTCAAQYQNGKRMVADEHDCTLRCVDQGAEFVFVSHGIVHPIRNQDFSDLSALAGAPVQLLGTVTVVNDAVVVSRLTAWRP